MSNRNYISITSLYLSMGLVAGLLGSLIVIVSQNSRVNLAASGTVMSLFNVGALLGIAFFNVASKRFYASHIVLIGTIMMTFSLFLVSNIHLFALALLLALLIGLGFGILDLGLAQLMTRSQETSIVRINISNAIFGVGGILGSLNIHFFGIESIGVIALISIVLGITASLTLLNNTFKLESHRKTIHSFDPKKIIIPVLFATAFYVALEISAASWLPSLSSLMDKDVRDGALATSLFYLLFTLGRFVAAPIAKKLSAAQMVMNSLYLTLIPLGAAFAVPQYSFWFVAMTGFTLGPIFANTTSLLAKLTPDNPAATTYLLYSAMAGSLLIFPLIGYLINENSYGIFVKALLSLLILCIVFFRLTLNNSQKVSHSER